MTFLAAIQEMVRRPDLMALCPPDKIVGFSHAGYLVNFATGPRSHARLHMRDLLNEQWELHTAAELDELARANQAQQ